MPTLCQSREEVQKAAPCLHSVKNRCDTQWRAEGVSSGVKKPVLEPQNRLDGNVREDTSLINETKCPATVAGVSQMGNVS